MDSPNPPLRLDISRLNITPEDPGYEDAIACVSMYWKQAVLPSPADQEEMIQNIIKRCYMMNKSSRAGIAAHRIYRAATTQNISNTWSAYLILSAIYRQLPWQYEHIVQQKFGSLTIESHLNSHFALYPDTVWPGQAESTGEHAARFKATYPKVKHVSYWARMSLPEPKIPDFRSCQADSVQSEHTDANTDPKVSATELDTLPDITVGSQDSTIVQEDDGAAAQKQDSETRPSNTPSALSPPTRPSASQDSFNINNIVDAITRERSGRGAHQMQRMQAIMRSMAQLEETSKGVVRQSEFNAFQEECNVFRNEFNVFREEFNAFREQESVFRDEIRQFMTAIAASFSANI
ncbi:hypothetical protein MKX08_007477 [Trichoderma sp. CBMAI-0020]|nr:hypothetical protein MKX08_007477 [Trichoderma sp. CBMAI-0020]